MYIVHCEHFWLKLQQIVWYISTDMEENHDLEGKNLNLYVKFHVRSFYCLFFKFLAFS
jgi:hypothetical protein